MNTNSHNYEGEDSGSNFMGQHPSEVPEWVKDRAKTSRKHLVFQNRLKRAMHVLRENDGKVPDNTSSTDAQWYETVRQIMLETGNKEIIGSGCLNDGNVIELMMEGYDETGAPANIFLCMNTSDVRHRAMLRHMGDIDMPKNLIVPILPFPYGFF